MKNEKTRRMSKYGWKNEEEEESAEGTLKSQSRA